jgi:hypothetical protein
MRLGYSKWQSAEWLVGHPQSEHAIRAELANQYAKRRVNS